jgi:hypothetical protein
MKSPAPDERGSPLASELSSLRADALDDAPWNYASILGTSLRSALPLKGRSQSADQGGLNLNQRGSTGRDYQGGPSSCLLCRHLRHGLSAPYYPYHLLAGCLPRCGGRASRYLTRAPAVMPRVLNSSCARQPSSRRKPLVARDLRVATHFGGLLDAHYSICSVFAPMRLQQGSLRLAASFVQVPAVTYASNRN